MIARRRFLYALLAAPLGLTARAFADVIGFRAGEVRTEDDNYIVNATFDLSINNTLEDALLRGVTLYFQLDIDVIRERWYWTDDVSASQSQTYRLSYLPLTRQFRLTTGLYTQNLANLEQAIVQLSRLRGRKLVERTALRVGERYIVRLRLRHDLTQLPKPLQVAALANRDWTLDSEAVRITFTAAP